jgi:hypothetical protein
MSRLLIIVGIILILIGLIWPMLRKFGIGHLPGDIIIKRGDFSFYFPITTCIIISLILTIILWISNR